MVQGINLLKPEKAKDIRLIELGHSLKIGSIVILLFYCLVVLTIFSFSIYLGQANEKIAQEIETKKHQITELKKVESLQLTLKQRLSSLTELITKKEVSYPQLLNQLDETLEAGITIKEISLTDAGVMTIGGTASQATVLARFLDKLTGEKIIFSTVVLTSISRQKDGSYLFNIDLKTDDVKTSS